MWPSSAMCSGSRSSVQNAIRDGPNSVTSGASARRFRAAEASRISSHIPARSRSRPSSAVYASWSERIPAAAYACRSRPSTPGRVPVDVVAARDGELRQLALGAGDHAGEVHHLREPDHAPPPQQALEVAGRERAARRLELRRRHARGGGEEDVERQVLADVDEPVDAVGAEHVRDLVRVGDDRGRAERQHEARELGREQLRGLEMHVRVDEPRHDVGAVRIERLGALVGAEPGDDAVADRDVDVEPFAREDAEDAAAADDEVGRFVAPRDRQSAGQITRLRHQSSNSVPISEV